MRGMSTADGSYSIDWCGCTTNNSSTPFGVT